MSKLRNVQFFRNGSPADSRAAAISAMSNNNVVSKLKDGEIVIGRYYEDKGGKQVVRSLIGVAYIPATGTKYLEIIPEDHIKDFINDLNVTGYGQASYNAENGKITIYGIKEVDGKIAHDTTKDVVIDLGAAITAKIEALDSVADADGGDGNATVTTLTTPTGDFKVLNSVTETDGKLTAVEAYTLKKVAATGKAEDVSVEDTDNVITATTVEGALVEIAKEIDGMDLTESAVIALNGTELKSNKISESDGKVKLSETADTLFTFKTAPSARNKVITESDITGIVGAMVYKGTIGNDGTITTLPTASVENKGHVYMVSTAGTYAGKDCEPGDMIVSNGTSWDVINGENQVDNKAATITAGANEATTIATVDGIDITAKVQVTDGSATIASINDGVVSLNQYVKQTNNTGTIGNTADDAIVLAKVASTGAAVDVSIADEGGIITATTVEGALQEIAGRANSAIQSVTGETLIANGNADYVAVHAETSNNAVTLSSNVKTVTLATAHEASETEGVVTPANDGLATALDVKNYITTTVEGLDATVTSETIAEGATQQTPVRTTIVETDGKLTSVTNAVLEADVVYTVETTTGETTTAANLAATSTNGVVLGSDIVEIKKYIDAKSNASSTEVTNGDGINVTNSIGSDGQTIYTVSAKVAEKAHVGDTTTVADEATNLLKLDADGSLSVSDTWDCGTF